MKKAELFFIRFPGVHREHREIQKNEYIKLSKARQDVFAIQQVEEHFNVILKSYEDFEKEILSISLSEITSPKDKMDRHISEEMWSHEMELLYLLNLRLIGFLVTSISYRDVLRERMASVFDRKANEFIRVTEIIEKELSKNWLYQLMIVLRNINVHQGKLINTLSKSQTRIEREKIFWKQTLHLRISIDELASNSRQIKGYEILHRKLNDLKNKGDFLELIPLIRNHMDLIGKVHTEARKILSKKAITIDKIISEAVNGNEFIFLKKTNEQGVVIEELTVFLDPIDRRQFLIRKNHILHRFSKRYVSGESPKLD